MASASNFESSEVKVVVTSTEQTHKPYICIRKWNDTIQSVKEEWCQVMGISFTCVEFLSGNRYISQRKLISELEESFPGVVDIICVPDFLGGPLRVVVNFEDKAKPEIFFRSDEDEFRELLLDVARLLSIDSRLLQLTCDNAHVPLSSRIGDLREKWPGYIELSGTILETKDASTQCRFKRDARSSRSEMCLKPEDMESMKWMQDEEPAVWSTRVRLGSELHLHPMNLSDTLGTVVDDLRLSYLLVNVCDVKSRGSSLCSQSWMDKRLQDCHVDEECEIEVEVKEQSVHVDLFVPPVPAPEEWDVSCQVFDNSWEMIAEKTPQLQAFAKDESVIAMQFGLFFQRNGFWRRAVHSINLSNNRKAFYSEEDGEPIEELEGDHFTCEFLKNRAGIRGACGVSPVLTVLREAEVLCVVRSKGPDAFSFVGPAALFDPHAVLLVRGLRLRNTVEGSDRMFILLAGGSTYCDLHDGTIYEEMTALPESQSCSPHVKWTEAFIVLKEGETLPRWPIPFGRYVRLLRRYGVDVQVSCDRRIRRHSPGPRSIGSSWIRPTEIDLFLSTVTAGMRRLFDHQYT